MSARLTLALLATLAMGLSCGDGPPAECHHPADCATVPGADTCKTVKGHGLCVLACAVVQGQDSCPATFHCNASADDGTTYCTSNP